MKCQRCGAEQEQQTCEPCQDDEMLYVANLPGFREEIRKLERARKETARLVRPKRSWLRQLKGWLYG